MVFFGFISDTDSPPLTVDGFYEPRQTTACFARLGSAVTPHPRRWRARSVERPHKTTDRTRNLQTSLAGWFNGIGVVAGLRADAPQFQRIEAEIDGCPQDHVIEQRQGDACDGGALWFERTVVDRTNSCAPLEGHRLCNRGPIFAFERRDPIGKDLGVPALDAARSDNKSLF
jgi:hypothetical protein